ncbi:hypothetical protein D3C80_1715030 [compost metagenome]
MTGLRVRVSVEMTDLSTEGFIISDHSLMVGEQKAVVPLQPENRENSDHKGHG